MSNILAIDLGHGHVKVLHSPAPGRVTRTVFPSYAAQVTDDRDATAAMAANLRVVTVDVDGTRYRVGKDIEMANSFGTERNRDDGYSTTPAYMALMLGAMYYTHCPTVDILMVGLPLTTLATNAERLRRKLEGVHRVPHFNPDEAALGKTTEVLVRRVEVIAQPLAALLAAIEQAPELKSARVLTLDYGFHTLDVLASAGPRPFPERLGAIPGGVASYIDQLQKSVGATIRAERPDISGEIRVPSGIYEKALQADPCIVSLSPGDYDLARHRQSAIHRLAQDLQRAVAVIQSANDINAIVLAGGGARLLADPVQRQFAAVKKVVTLDDPQFAIARGYLALGRLVTTTAAEGDRAAA